MRAARLPRRLARLGLGAVVLFAVGTAQAQDGAADTLKTLYRIALSAEMCGFPIAPRQSEALGRAMNRAMTESGLDADAGDRLYLEVDSALEAEGWEKICASDGDWAHGFRALLAANTK